MDPINFAVACGAASGVVGFIVGGALFGRLWRLLFRRTAAQLDEVKGQSKQVVAIIIK